MIQKYFSQSPYNYVLNDPIKFVDYDGMDVYVLTSEGKVILAKKEDKPDFLFSIDDKGNKVDTDKNGKIDDKDGVTVKTKGLLGQMTSIRSVYKEKNIHSIVSENFNQAEKDLLNLFHFVSNNTHVEFALTYFKHNKKDYISLSTYGYNDKSPGAAALGLNDKDIRKSYHNHPDANSDFERRSMGTDHQIVVDNKITHPVYVYFRKSTNLYNVTQKGVYFIQKINNDYKKLKK